VDLKIYDASGKLVRTLFNGNMDPGIHKIVWDGKNSKGGTVSSGVYFFRFVLNNTETFTRKAVLLR
jgi:flagellar hook assembly protein FlgD